MSQPLFKNGLLLKLPVDVIARLELQPVDLPVTREIEYPGNHIDHLFFIEEGIASMTATFEDGFQVEIALAGSEAVLGTSAMMGTRRSLNRVYMQVGGYGFSSQTAVATREFARGGAFHDLTLRYLQARFIQSAQTAGCNARHTVEQRLARWLLLCADRNGGRVLPLSQEYLADMLGSSRTTVTTVAGHFQDRNLIQYTRGKIHLVDLPGLELLACECYRVVRDHLADYAEYNVIEV
ncbi:MAG: Crp/Fnr family transcriptional regulator [Granulicella sp.]